ncbi:MAG TPA: TIGR02147 family protein [Fibrobacteria bacterium]|mgnify:FL=1|nr:TIGR02147 family protein [Fibrobacteria bacterium]
MPDIYDYTDYRKYLSELYAARKANNRAFSYRMIAQKAGLASPSFIGKIFSGIANISHSTLMRLVDVFELVGPDAEYFELMVHFEGSRSEIDKSHYFQRMQALRRRHGKSAGNDADVVQSAWYVGPILSLIELGLFHGDHAALGRMLTPPISSAQVRLAIELLMLNGQIRKECNGRHVLVRNTSDPPPGSIPAPTKMAGIPLEPNTLLEALPASTPDELRDQIRSTHAELVRLLCQANENRQP